MSVLKEDVEIYVKAVFKAFKNYKEKQRNIEKVAAFDLDAEAVEFFLSDETFVNVAIESKEQGQKFHFTFDTKDFLDKEGL